MVQDQKQLKAVMIEPWGIHVSLMESLRFLLLKAVMIPITKKTFGRSFKILAPGSVTIGDPSSLSALEALAAASCTSNDEIVLSNVLKNSSRGIPQT